MNFKPSSWKWHAHGKGIGRIGLLLGSLVLVSLVVLRLIDPPPVELLRHQLFDLYQRIKPASFKDVPVVIVDIDEASLKSIGQWPWPRPVIADLVKKLATDGAVVLGFDVIFAEPDRVSPPVLADEIVGIDDAVRDYLRKLPDNDAALAQIVGATRTVLAEAGSTNAAALVDRPPPKKASIAEIGGDPRRFLYTHKGITRNIPILEDAAHGLGVINLAPERDGVTRRVPLAIAIGDTIVPTLGVEMLRLATGQSTIGIRSDDAGINSIVLAGLAIPTDSSAEVWVRFAPAYSIPYISAKDVLDGTVDPAMIAGKFVLIGTSAVGLLDIKTTPLAAFMPGVEVHAQFLANVLSQKLLSRPGFLLATEIAVTILAAILILVLIPRLSAIATLLFGAVLMVLLLGVSWYLFAYRGILFDVTATVVTTFAVYGVLTYVKYVREEADKKMVRRTFSQYLAPAVVDQLAEHPEQLKLGGESREMTILFSDIRGFTSISERLEAAQLTQLINRILTPLTEAILESGGTVDKYIGDCVMAFWNAPLDDPHHAHNGCVAALDMIHRIDVLNAVLAQEAAESGTPDAAPPAIRIGVGLNTGVCSVGNFGSDQRFDYSVLGDTVNLSSRLEGQTSFYGCPIIIGESTAAAAAELAMVQVDRLKVVGRQQPVEIHALLGDEEFAQRLPFRHYKGEHEAFLGAYFAQRWQSALDKAVQCRRLASELNLPIDHLYEVFIDRITSYRERPVDTAWDGAFAAIKK